MRFGRRHGCSDRDKWFAIVSMDCKHPIDNYSIMAAFILSQVQRLHCGEFVSEDTTCCLSMPTIESDSGTYKRLNFGGQQASTRLKSFSARVAGRSCKPYVGTFQSFN